VNAPEVTAVHLLCVVVALFTAYLVLIVVLRTTAAVTRFALLARVSDVITPRALRTIAFVTTTAAVGMPTMANASDGGASDPPIVMHRLPTETTTSTTITTPTTAANAPAQPLQSPEPEPPQRVWTVQKGEHFWAIAQHTLGSAWGRAVTVREIIPYWKSLIEANRSHLRNPDNPNLLYPGQELSLPPVQEKYRR
jgi:nucleoid-associated protein YgaU